MRRTDKLHFSFKKPFLNSNAVSVLGSEDLELKGLHHTTIVEFGNLAVLMFDTVF